MQLLQSIFILFKVKTKKSNSGVVQSFVVKINGKGCRSSTEGDMNMPANGRMSSRCMCLQVVVLLTEDVYHDCIRRIYIWLMLVGWPTCR